MVDLKKMNLFSKFFVVFFCLTEYSHFNGKVDAQIISGGLVSQIEEYPFMIGILYHQGVTRRVLNCGGSIVSPFKIVTAGHCILNRKSFSLVMGTLNIRYPGHMVDITDKDITLHPKFSNGPPWTNDIAVIQLRTPLQFDAKLNKIEMVTENNVVNTGDGCTTLGFTEGSVIDRTPSYSNLRFVDSTIADFEKCDNAYFTDKKRGRLWRVAFGNHSWLDESKQICVNLRDGVHLTNKGDSGGALLTSDKKLIGITSYDFKGLPEICAKISGYLSFISNPKQLRGTVDGYVYEIETHNYMVAIMYESNNSKRVCNGVIIANNRIVTAASCVHNAQSVTLAFSTINTDETFGYSMDISGEEIIIHQGYSAGANDIAMLQLKKSLNFGPNMDKIDIITKNYVPKPGTDIFILGYSESNSTRRSYLDTHLRLMNATIVHPKLCRVTNTQRQICVKFRENTSNKYSGAPVVTADTKGNYKLLGIISFGNNTFESPKVRVCTLVSAHSPFIRRPYGPILTYELDRHQKRKSHQLPAVERKQLAPLSFELEKD